MAEEPVVLINHLKVDPGNRDALIALLKRNTDAVVRTLPGWKTTQLIAAKEGASVVIHSEWESSAAVEGMRADPHMKAHLPQIVALASLEAIVGAALWRQSRPK